MTMGTIAAGLGGLGRMWLPLFVDLSLKGLALLAGAALGAFFLRRASAATRHAIWAVGAGTLLVLPAIVWVTPDLSVEMPFVAEALDVEKPVGGSSEAAEPGIAVEPALDQAGVVSAGAESPVRSHEGRASVPTAGGAAALQPGVASPGGGEPRPERGEPGWAELLFLVWAMGAFGLGLRLGVGFLRVRRLAREAGVAGDPDLLERVRDLSSRIGLKRRVEVRLGGPGSVPMTWGLLRPVLFLPETMRTWSRRRLEHVLLHELAHIKRRDHLVQVLAEVAVALHWMNPLAWLAASRMRTLREWACDDRVLVSGSRPSGYARDLLAVARSLGAVGPAGLVAAPMARSSRLEDRLGAILDSTRPRRGPGAFRVGLTVVGALGVALPLAALAPARDVAAAAASGGPEPSAQEMCALQDEGPHSTSVHIDDDRSRIEWSSEGCSVTVEIRGDVEFGPEDRTIARVPAGGLFDLEERVGGARRRLRMEPGGGDGVEVDYRVNGDRRPFDAEGRAWLAALLPEIFRQTGLNADARARRILDREGVDGLLAEIGQIESDHVARLYFDRLMALAELDEAGYRRILRLAAERMGSDYQRAELLLAVAERSGLPPGLRGPFLEVAREIDSDHHLRRVLEALLRGRELDAGSLAEVLRVTEALGSDYHRAEVLILAARSDALGGVALEAFRDAAAGIASDHHLRRTLEALLESPGLDDRRVSAVLDLARRISSDHHRAELLAAVARRRRLEGPLREAYLLAAEEIGSRSQRERALNALTPPGPIG